MRYLKLNELFKGEQKKESFFDLSGYFLIFQKWCKEWKTTKTLLKKPKN